MVSSVSTGVDQEIWDHLSERIPPPGVSLAKLFTQHLGDEVNYEVLLKYVGVKGRISGKGLGLALKTGARFAK